MRAGISQLPTMAIIREDQEPIRVLAGRRITNRIVLTIRTMHEAA